jgi:hypothetical protein
MIQLTYYTVAKPEDIYLSTEDNRIDTSVASNQLDFMFKLTNDMSGEIIYVYSASVNVYNRYTKLNLAATQTPNLYNGYFKGLPVGYYGYELYELTKDISGYIAKTCSTAPPTSTGVIGKIEVKNPAGTSIYSLDLTGKNDVYEKTLTSLDAGTYDMDLTNTCDTKIVDSGFIIGTDTAQTDNTRYAEIKNLVQTSTGVTFDMVSNMPVGHSYGFSVGSAAETQVTNITSKPQTTSHSFAQVANPTTAANLVVSKQYNQTGGAAGGGAIVGTTINIRPVTETSTYYGIAIILASNNVLNSTTGSELEKGNAWLTSIYGASAASTSKGYYTLQGKVTEGKMYISQGDENLKQVTYKQHEEPAGTNYIYYGQ